MQTNTETIERGRGKNKHFWTMDEDAALLESLHELYQSSKWRGDSGFKNGYAIQLETMMEGKLPGCGLKASPHIESRIKTLKSKYFALSEMLSHRGFGWNDKQMMLICDKRVYNEWVKSHREANGLYGKPFLHYETLKEIYCKERASGANVRSSIDRDDIQREDADQEDLDIVDLQSNPVADVNAETQVDGSGDYEVSFTQQPSSRRRKSAENSPSVSNRKCRVRIRVVEEMGKSFGSMAASIATMAQKLDNVWSNDKEVATMQAKLDNELTKIQGLTELQVFRATNILATKHDLLRVFFSMSKERRRSYVFNLLEYGL
ncbi:uncharacterized protein LOC21400367 [Morus notabilis]|nr:uncharacterized protein LOC21400367 [Morus notabilis]